MADIKISELTAVSSLNNGDLVEVSQVNALAPSGYTSLKASMTDLGKKVNADIEYTTDLADFEDKTALGAIKETAKDKNIADEYDDTQTYDKGDVVIYKNTLHICTTNNTTGTWDATKWTATTVQSLIGSLSTLTTTDKSSLVGAVNEIAFEEGSSGVWTWRKWNNGKLEIWGYDNSQMTVGASAWGSVYSIDIASLGDYPIAFLTLHSVIGAVYINGANGLGTLTGGTSYGLTKAPAYMFIRGTALGSDTRYVTRNIYAVGTWK